MGRRKKEWVKLTLIVEENEEDPRTVVWFEQGEVVTEEQDQLRAPNFFNTERIDDPVLQTQRMIAEKLGPHFKLIRAVSFSNRGK